MQLGRKVLIINDPAQAELLFFAKLANGVKRLVETDDDFQTTTAFDDLAANPDVQSGAEGSGFNPAAPSNDETIAQAQILRILGFGDFEGSDIVEVIGAKGISAVKQISTITFTVNSVVPGQEIVVDLAFKADDLRGEFASHLSDYKKFSSIVLTIKAGDTATTVATRLKNIIEAINDSNGLSLLTIATAAGVATITSTDAKVTFTATFSGSAVDAGTVTAAFATTTEGYSGRNTYEQLKSVRLETLKGEYVESHKELQVPIKGAKYSSYIIRKNVSRPDLAGVTGTINSIPSGIVDFEIYINEATASTYLTNLVKWLNANVAKRTMYTATAASDALSAEAPTTATVVDSTEPFGTPLV